MTSTSQLSAANWKCLLFAADGFGWATVCEASMMAVMKMERRGRSLPRCWVSTTKMGLNFHGNNRVTVLTGVSEELIRPRCWSPGFNCQPLPTDCNEFYGRFIRFEYLWLVPLIWPWGGRGGGGVHVYKSNMSARGEGLRDICHWAPARPVVDRVIRTCGKHPLSSSWAHQSGLRASASADMLDLITATGWLDYSRHWLKYLDNFLLGDQQGRTLPFSAHTHRVAQDYCSISY